MNLSQFIASRLNQNSSQGYSSFITNVASVAVAISVAVMILAVTISKGYDVSIRKKIFGFWGHIQITDVSSNLNLDEKPILKDSLFTQELNKDYVKSVSYFALKSALIKTDSAIHGVILKGVEDDFDWSEFSDFLVEGVFPKTKNEVLISKGLAELLHLKIGDKLKLHFIQKPMRARAPKITGFYTTNLVELDEQIIFSSIETIRALNGWEKNQVGGVELFVKDPRYASVYAEDIQRNYTTYDKWVKSIDKSNPEIFDWLNFLKTNQWLILSLMAVVAIVNMVSMLLVIILERSKMIGVLKALGSPYSVMRNIFLRKALRIILVGLFFGNLIGIGLALIQHYFKPISLNPEMYFLSHVPVSISVLDILLLNIATVLVILLALFLPTLFIKRINPIQVLRFE